MTRKQLAVLLAAKLGEIKAMQREALEIIECYQDGNGSERSKPLDELSRNNLRSVRQFVARTHGDTIEAEYHLHKLNKVLAPTR